MPPPHGAWMSLSLPTRGRRCRAIPRLTSFTSVENGVLSSQSHPFVQGNSKVLEKSVLTFSVARSRNPTVLLRAILRPHVPAYRRRARHVAIPPYCSGQFRAQLKPLPRPCSPPVSRNPTALIRGNSECQGSLPAYVRSWRRNPTVPLRAIPNTCTASSPGTRSSRSRNPTVLLRVIPRQPTDLQPRRRDPAEVAIPPYCSGRFQAYPFQPSDSGRLNPPESPTSQNPASICSDGLYSALLICTPTN